MLENREKQKQLRHETRYFEQGKQFNEDFNPQVLFRFLVELLVKSNGLLRMVSDTSTAKDDELRILEMSLNKNDIMRKCVCQC